MTNGEGPLRKVWSVGSVGVWKDEQAGFTAAYCDDCKRLLFLVDSRVSLEVLKEATAAHAAAHARTHGEQN